MSSTVTATGGQLPAFDVFSNFRNTINGRLTTTKETRHSINPATGEANAPVPVSTQDDVEEVMQGAQKAFKTWRNIDYESRRQCLVRFIALMKTYQEDFTRLLTTEQGKPLPLAAVEIEKTIQSMQVTADLDLKEQVLQEDDEKKIICRYTPIGVAVGIVPWNFPVLLACEKLAPATLAGNPIIIKPSPFTPYCGLKLVELAQQCFPPGVIQALSGDDTLGPWLTAHPIPEKISFTGSTATGKKVMETASKTLKRVTLELGGNDPAIVCADVDIESTAQQVAHFSFLNSGQICLAIKRIYVHESIFEPFRDAMVRYVQNLTVGNGTEDGIFMGPVQNGMQYDRVKGFFDDINKGNLTVAVGGQNPDRPGYFITPTVIDRPAENSRIVVEEPFGPIVPLMTWTDQEDVISRANDTRMGLGASVWSRNLEQADQIARQIEAGSVWINTHYALRPEVPYGGHKESGIGLESGMGGLLGFCNVQHLHIIKK